jgi:hypothetical protein
MGEIRVHGEKGVISTQRDKVGELEVSMWK